MKRLKGFHLSREGNSAVSWRSRVAEAHRGRACSVTKVCVTLLAMAGEVCLKMGTGCTKMIQKCEQFVTGYRGYVKFLSTV